LTTIAAGRGGIEKYAKHAQIDGKSLHNRKLVAYNQSVNALKNHTFTAILEWLPMGEMGVTFMGYGETF
jgi:hypothetical protein